MKIFLEQTNLNLLCGLLFACPMDNEADSCPFRSIRKLPVDVRLIILENLSHLDQEMLFMHHRKCLCPKDICSQVKPKYTEPSNRSSAAFVNVSN